MNAALPVPVPRSSTRFGGASIESSAASSEANASGPRIWSQRRRHAVELERVSRRSNRQAHGRRTTWFVVNRANLRPSLLENAHSATLTRTSTPGRAKNVSAALPPLIAIAMLS